MTEKVNGSVASLTPSNRQLSYVLSITIPQPTIRIRIPKILARAMQRRNHEDFESVENGSSKGRRNLRRKVGSMFSHVFRGKKSSSSEIADCSDEENVNGEHEDNRDDQKTKNRLKSIVEGKEIEPVVKTTRKSSDNDVQEMVVATGFGVSRSICLKDTVTKSLNIRNNNDETEKTASGDDDVVGKTSGAAEGDGDEPVNSNSSLSILVAGDERHGPRSVRTRMRSASVEHEMPYVIASKTLINSKSHRKLKVAWSLRRIFGREEKQELCKKRILMGGKCRPLGTIEYDENGILLPETNH